MKHSEETTNKRGKKTKRETWHLRRLPDWRRFLAAIIEATRAEVEEGSLASFFRRDLFFFLNFMSSPFAIVEQMISMEEEN